jgi:uncharacterized protein YbjT (DUF2867 family)
MRARKIFVAGSTGATGQLFVPMARERGLEVVPHVRPKSSSRGAPGAVAFELADAAALEKALADCTTVVSLIGTMRKRFKTGDTYETSDIETARQLTAAAKKAGVDHFILLSAAGTGTPFGSYLKAKAKAEAVVRESGVPWTIFRPSSFIGGGHNPPAIMKVVTKALGMRNAEPIPLETVARALVRSAAERGPLEQAIEGEPIWTMGAA